MRGASRIVHGTISGVIGSNHDFVEPGAMVRGASGSAERSQWRGSMMPTGNKKVDLPTMLRDPAGVFRSPRDVLEHPDLTQEERLAILQQWERDARGLSVAEEEGMGGGEESLLSRVRRAIAQLGDGSAVGGPGTKHG